ncbi:MAG TPA: (2Fe-2S)-binding protein [Burkholderiales bacterium]|nr:(2Fe-2S)-binding protein [Burkholderiales bacterium]
MQRRDFIGVCAATCALGAHETLVAADLKPRLYSRTQLTDEQGRPLKAASLAAGRNYIFHYPFESTPCFLLNLGKPTVRDVLLKTEKGSEYQWPGGVGPGRAIVGYSAICAHRLTYPTPQISFISYREKSRVPGTARPNTIHCCSEHSEYDPAAGAKVVGGPAQQPLAAILLEHNAKEDSLYAVGTLGGELFNAFFEKYEFKLAIDYGSNMTRRQVSGRTVVKELERFCRQQVRC